MRPIFLIGYMGAGKTTVGKALAKRLGISFIDMDAYIEGRYRKTVSLLFTEKGEAGFRQTEQKILHEVAQFENVLVATGGGAPCFFDNMTVMNRLGLTIYLRVAAQDLAKRLEQSGQTRPVLEGKTGDQLLQFIDQSLGQREPFYSRAAVTFDVGRLITSADVQQIVDALAEKI